MDKPIILVVDDEPEIAKYFVDVINENGRYAAISAYSAKEALDLLNKYRKLLGLAGNKIKLILLDIKMPEMDGLQFLEAMRRQYNEEQIGVIMLTAYEDADKWDRATSGLVSGYLKKPVAKEDLLASIERFFSSPSARDEMTVDTFKKHIDKKEEFEFEARHKEIK